MSASGGPDSLMTCCLHCSYRINTPGTYLLASSNPTAFGRVGLSSGVTCITVRVKITYGYVSIKSRYDKPGGWQDHLGGGAGREELLGSCLACTVPVSPLTPPASTCGTGGAWRHHPDHRPGLPLRCQQASPGDATTFVDGHTRRSPLRALPTTASDHTPVLWPTAAEPSSS